MFRTKCGEIRAGPVKLQADGKTGTYLYLHMYAEKCKVNSVLIAQEIAHIYAE